MEDDSDIGITKAAPELLKNLDIEFQKGNVDKVRKLLDPFQDSPQLLDSRLQNMMTKLTSDYLETLEDWPCEIIYTLCKVRGAKVVSRFFPSSASLLEKLSTELEKSTGGTWERRYVLLLWLSILILIPFNLNSTIKQDFDRQVYDIVREFLTRPGKERDAAALVMARLLTRSDTNLMDKFVIDSGLGNNSSGLKSVGYMQTFSQIWRLANAHEFEKYAVMFVDKLYTGDSIYGQKLMAKNLGRIALIFMTTETEVGENVEMIISKLIEMLGNPESTVRYTSSKAVARIVVKLDDEMKQEVSDAVLEVFDENIITKNGSESLDRVSSHSWHGGLLCIAEMLRRRLISRDQQLPKLVSILKKSLHFEQKRLTSALGPNVRDASCYVCWSLFRVYKKLPVDILETLLESLVGLCCFDREINIRRAASAAIQEGIGRQGDPIDIARGLELIQLVDYFHVGRRKKAFLEISESCCDLGYKNITNVVLKKVDSWDIDVRRLAAQALAKKISFVPILLKMYNKRDFEMQHGVLMALGELLLYNGCTHADECIALLENMTTVELCDENEVTNCEGYMHLFSALFRHYNSLTEKQQDRMSTLMSKTHLAMDVNTEYIVSDAQCVARALMNNCNCNNQLLDQTVEYWCKKVYKDKPVYAQTLGFINTSQCQQTLTNVAYSYKNNDANVRKIAVTSLTRLLLLEDDDNNNNQIDVIVDMLNDYTIDSRGDVGSWVRKAAIDSCVCLYSKMNETQQQTVILQLLKLSAEVLDRMRVQASDVLIQIAPERISTVLNDNLSIIEDRLDPTAYFTGLTSLFNICNNTELESLITGYVCSSGAIHSSTNTLVGSLHALTAFLASSSSSSSAAPIITQILKLVDIKQYGSKICISALRTLSGLFESGYELPSSLNTNKFMRIIFVRVYNAHINTKNIMRITAAVEVFAALAQQGHKDSLKQLVKSCQHRLYPVRSHASECLYEVVSITDEYEDAMVELSEIDWEQSPDELEPVVENLYNALKL